jgi:hypothetical protein
MDIDRHDTLGVGEALLHQVLELRWALFQGLAAKEQPLWIEALSARYDLPQIRHEVPEHATPHADKTGLDPAAWRFSSVFTGSQHGKGFGT